MEPKNEMACCCKGFGKQWHVQTGRVSGCMIYHCLWLRPVFFPTDCQLSTSGKEKSDKKDEREGRSKRTKMWKSRKTLCLLVVLEGSKGRLPKAAGAEPCGGMGTEKVHVAVAGSAFGSEKRRKC